ncbi:MAG: methylaspartate mutase subunit E, partial [Nitrospirae bacterium]|nr:methylaspartate mutase subunit E [Nitrospirota bacterium]
LENNPLFKNNKYQTIPESFLEPAVFDKMRKRVLDHWKTGFEAKNLDENAKTLSSMPMFTKPQCLVNTGKIPILIQPRSGVGLLNEQIELFKNFKNFGVKVLSFQVDSLTRNNNYIAVEEAIKESNISRKSLINGFPVVNYGVTNVRRVIKEVNVPVQTRHSTRDPRLLAEISYAGGVSAFEGGAITYNIPYYKDYSLNESIRKWMYVDYLTGLYYSRYGIILDREFFGAMTATLIPPCLAITVCLLEMILAITQGVKSFSLGYAEQGNRVQDIAAIQVMREKAVDIVVNMGYNDIQINTVFYQYMAAFPQIIERAENLIYNSAITAALSGATRVIIKTPVESYKIPSMLDNIHGLNLVTSAVNDASDIEINKNAVIDECSIIKKEVQLIFDSILLCGDGDIIKGIIKGFEKGFIDIPFSPSIYNQGKALTARDMSGAIRFLSIGNIQLDKELIGFHEEKMNERRHNEGFKSKAMDYLIVEKDVLMISRGQYNSWPLDG